MRVESINSEVTRRIMTDGKDKLFFLPGSPVISRKRPRMLLNYPEVTFENDRRSVYLRIKPDDGKVETFAIIDENTLSPILEDQKLRKGAFQKYKFTKIFGAECGQEEIFKKTCSTPLSNFLHGGNCFVFAYGATNAGKTFTIQGNSEKPGIIPRALNLMFNSIKDKVSKEIKFKPDKVNNILWLTPQEIEKEKKIKESILNVNLEKSKTSKTGCTTPSHIETNSLSKNATTDTHSVCSSFQDMKTNLNDEKIELNEDITNLYSLWVSFAEIYNENIYDLLQPASKPRKPLLMGENDKKEVYIKGLIDVCVTSAEQAYKVFMYGRHNLHQASTSINHVSSRSHSVFIIKLIKHLKSDCPTFARLSICTFIDLAGAERAKKTRNVGERMKESQSINTSLHVLGKCLEVMRYNQRQNHGKEHLTKMLPCRESKLTRLFQRALEGKEDFTMIVNISPNKKVFQETINVLKFSATAMEVQFENLHDSNVFSLRKSSFALYMEMLSSTPCQSTENLLDSTENKCCMKLLAYIEELKKNLEEEKNKYLSLEVEIRKEAETHFRKIMLDMENTNKQRSINENEPSAEFEDNDRTITSQRLLYNALKRSQEDLNKENKNEDYEEKIELLQKKVEILTELVESGNQLKSAHTTLETEFSKMQFELATVKLELANALKVNESISQGGNENNTIIKKLREDITRKQNLLKDKDTNLEELRKLVEDAKAEYNEHFRENEDFVKRNVELDKMLTDRDLKIGNLQKQLEVNSKELVLQQQRCKAEILEKAEYIRKLQFVCEARDEYKFKTLELECMLNKLKKENKVLENQIKTPHDESTKALHLLEASHEDEIKCYTEKLKSQEEANKLLEEEITALKESVIKKQNSYDKKINNLQIELNEVTKSKKELMITIENIFKKLQESKEALQLSEVALLEEQNNTAHLQKMCEAEKNKVLEELQHLQNLLTKCEENSAKLLQENNDLKSQELELGKN